MNAGADRGEQYHIFHTRVVTWSEHGPLRIVGKANRIGKRARHRENGCGVKGR